jgi:hypothetical protein
LHALLQDRSVQQLKAALERGGYTLEEAQLLYIQASYGACSGQSTLEFLFAEDDNTVQLRGLPAAANGVSTRVFTGRLEQLRKALRWQEVVILRNGKRLFGDVESPFDSFGDAPPLGTEYGTMQAW